MKIKLIAPREQREDSLSSSLKLQRVNLPLLAALTSPGHTVTIVDEAFAPDDTNQDVDLVGITVMTDVVPRAYDIADAYRRKAVKVVMGGIHPTVLPDEALEHADAVVVGEAEGLWPRLLSDAASGQMQKLYRAGKKTALNGLPKPRRDLFPESKGKGYIPIPIGVETSRGCPNDCEFCSIGRTLGRQYRVRPVQEVIAEIETIDSPYIFFVDDALALNRNAAK
ncbi:MAG: cobalamin B12-binding domain protein, partial [Nitrospirae bacterium]|nr:cobalamin B12-binding domain protein [Nitrospirota bacterium]